MAVNRVMRISSINVVVAVVVLMMTIVLECQSQASPAQGSCTNQLTSLSVCAPFVAPGTSSNTTPNSQCCNALQSIDRDCMCNTIRIASRLPSLCNINAIPCDMN